MPLITNATGTPTNIDGANTSLNTPTLNFVFQGSPVLGNNPRTYDETANSTGSSLNSILSDNLGGILIDDEASLTIRRNTLITNRICSHQNIASNELAFAATDSTIYMTGTNRDTLGGNFPGGFNGNANSHLFGTINLTRTNLFSTYAAPNEQNNQGGMTWGNITVNSLRFNWEDVEIGPSEGGTITLSFGGLDGENSSLTRVSFLNGCLVLLPRRWNSVDTIFNTQDGIITRIFGTGTAGYPVFSQLDASSATGTDPNFLLDSNVTALFINALVPPAGVPIHGNGGTAKSIFAATILGSRFSDPSTESIATDATLKFGANRTFAKGAAFAIGSDIPAFTGPATIPTGFRSSIAGYNATQVENGIVVVRDALGDDAEGTTIGGLGDIATLTPLTTAPAFAAWSFTHNVPFTNTLNSFTRTGVAGTTHTLYGTPISSDDPDAFEVIESYAAPEDPLTIDQTRATYLVSPQITDGQARSAYQIPNLVDLYRTMKALWAEQERNLDFTTAVSVDNDLNLVLTGDFSLNASGTNCFWHGGTLNRFAIGKDTTGTPLAAVPGVIEGLTVQGELPLPDNATTLIASVASATDDITGMPDSIGSAGNPITISAGGRFRFQSDTTAKTFTDVTIIDGDLNAFPGGSSFVNCTVPATVRVTSNSDNNPVGSFTLDGGNYAFELSNLQAGNHTWTINNNPTLAITGIPPNPTGLITIVADTEETRTTVLAWLDGLGITPRSNVLGTGYFVPQIVVTYNIVFPQVAGNYIIRNSNATFATGATTTAVTSVPISTTDYSDASNVTIYWTAGGHLDVVQPFGGMDTTIAAIEDPNVAVGSFSGTQVGTFASNVATFTGTTDTENFAGSATNLWWNQAKTTLPYTQATVVYREASVTNTTPLIRLTTSSTTSVNGDFIKFASGESAQQVMTNLSNSGTASITSTVNINASQIAFQTAGSYTSTQAQADFEGYGITTDASVRTVVDEELDRGRLTRVGRPA